MDEKKQGGLTGATGNLTPDEAGEVFVPAETREISDPAAARQLTAAAHRRAEARRTEGDDEPGRLREEGAPIDRGAILGGDERHDPEKEHL